MSDIKLTVLALALLIAGAVLGLNSFHQDQTVSNWYTVYISAILLASSYLLVRKISKHNTTGDTDE